MLSFARIFRRRKARASEYNASLLAIVNERSRASHKANIAYYAMSLLSKLIFGHIF